MHAGSLIPGLLVASLMVAAPGSATACGHQILQAFVSSKYPETTAVSAALVEAENQGDLQGDLWETTSGQSLHDWRAERIGKTIDALNSQLNRTGPPLAAASATHILLLNELTWLDITYDGKRISVSRTQRFGPGKDGVIVFTTRRLIDNVLAGTISWRQAVSQGLVASRCADACEDQPYGLLGPLATTPEPNTAY
jgi:hypothetical protein